MEQPKRIIVRAPNWLGDHIMAGVCYQRIRAIFPQAAITLLLPEGLEGIVPEELFQDQWTFKKSDLRSSEKRALWVEKLKAGQFDMSISLTASWSSALLFFKARIPRRVGFSEGGSGILLHTRMKWRGVRSGRHKSELYQELTQLLVREAPGKNVQTQRSSHPRSRKNFWIVAPGAALPLREWPYFPELLQEITQRFPEKKIRIVGTSLESAWHSRIQRWQLPQIEDWIGKTSLIQLKQMAEDAELVIANDSGIAHLAATLSGAKTIVIFGPGTPSYISPRGDSVFSVVPDSSVSCSPCEKPYCRSPLGYQKCLRSISWEQVLHQIESALSL